MSNALALCCHLEPNAAVHSKTYYRINLISTHLSTKSSYISHASAPKVIVRLAAMNTNTLSAHGRIVLVVQVIGHL